MRLTLAALAAATFVIAGPAFADTREVLVNNTLILSDGTGDGHQAAYLLNGDGTFFATSYEGPRWRGSWTLKDGRLCLKPEAQAPTCVPMGNDRIVGYNWDIKGPGGETAWHAEIHAGRETIGRRAAEGQG